MSSIQKKHLLQFRSVHGNHVNGSRDHTAVRGEKEPCQSQDDAKDRNGQHCEDGDIGMNKNAVKAVLLLH